MVFNISATCGFTVNSHDVLTFWPIRNLGTNVVNISYLKAVVHISSQCKPPNRILIRSHWTTEEIFFTIFLTAFVLKEIAISPPCLHTSMNVRLKYLLFGQISAWKMRVWKKFFHIYCMAAPTNMICWTNCVINLFLFDSVSERWWK